VRHVLNMAQVRGSAPSLRLITFDADGTLYEDGAHFERDNAMIRKIIALLQAGLHVGVVTAAGYPGEAARFEGRLKGLLVRLTRCATPRQQDVQRKRVAGEGGGRGRACVG
jgi:IMP and pyridine-specific 5'-nucleotidase